MNKHCIICGGEFWKDHSPLPGDDRYCTACAERCCEIVEDMHAHTVVGETKDFTYPRWVWENANKLFANIPLCVTTVASDDDRDDRDRCPACGWHGGCHRQDCR